MQVIWKKKKKQWEGRNMEMGANLQFCIMNAHKNSPM